MYPTKLRSHPFSDRPALSTDDRVGIIYILFISACRSRISQLLGQVREEHDGRLQEHTQKGQENRPESPGGGGTSPLYQTHGSICEQQASQGGELARMLVSRITLRSVLDDLAERA